MAYTLEMYSVFVLEYIRILSLLWLAGSIIPCTTLIKSWNTDGAFTSPYSIAKYTYCSGSLSFKDPEFESKCMPVIQVMPSWVPAWTCHSLKCGLSSWASTCYWIGQPPSLSHNRNLAMNCVSLHYINLPYSLALHIAHYPNYPNFPIDFTDRIIPHLDLTVGSTPISCFVECSAHSSALAVVTALLWGVTKCLSSPSFLVCHICFAVAIDLSRCPVLVFGSGAHCQD